MTHPVLWTGGWDSTFRVADLALSYGRAVRPIYVLDPGRRSTRLELAAIDRLRRAIKTIDRDATALIGPLERYRLEDISHEPEVTRSWERLRDRAHIGGQYDWLARLAHQIGLPLELGIIRDGRIARSFLDGFTYRSDAPPPDDVWLVGAGAGPDVRAVFGQFALPLLGVTKLDMARLAKDRGYAEVLERTWFCHTPTLLGRPCGFCNPCRYTRDDGLGRRVPPPTARRRRWRQRKKRLLRA